MFANVCVAYVCQRCRDRNAGSKRVGSILEFGQGDRPTRSGGLPFNRANLRGSHGTSLGWRRKKLVQVLGGYPPIHSNRSVRSGGSCPTIGVSRETVPPSG